MRYRNALYLFAYFVIVWMVAAFLSSAHKRELADLINEAGRNGEPVIATSIYGGLTDLAFELFIPGGESRSFGTNAEFHPMWMNFAEDGTLHLFNRVVFTRTGTHRIIRFPDTGSTMGSTPTYNINHTRFVPYNVMKWEVFIADEGCLIINILNGDNWIIEFEETPPWVLEGASAPHYINSHRISDDGNSIFITEETDSPSGNEKIWRYDVESGTWTTLCSLDLAERPDLVVSSAGEMISVLVESSGSSPPGSTRVFTNDMVFLNGRTGEELHREYYPCAAVLGTRWACVILYAARRANATLVLLDMENNFARTTIAARAFCGLAIYEPPPNGLDGMYENYVPDNE
ncbi:hypothetical protein KAU08_13105 [bacterium]|nr:hypothetical protein [bacterium]